MNTGSSKYKGVGWNKQRAKWRASIYDNNRKIHLGYFDDEIDAAKAFNKEAKKIRGEFAVINEFYTLKGILKIRFGGQADFFASGLRHSKAIIRGNLKSVLIRNAKR